MMNGYTADDGLAVLEHLECMNLTESEVRFLKEKWEWVYYRRNGNFIGTIRQLYCEILPQAIGYSNGNNVNGHKGHANRNGKMKVERIIEQRKRRFDSSLGRSNLAHILKEAGKH